jgi:hypothetical protein
LIVIGALGLDVAGKPPALVALPIAVFVGGGWGVYALSRSSTNHS